MESSPQKPSPSSLEGLTKQDLKDREDFKYLLSIMEKQGNVWGTLRQFDIDEASRYADRLKSFLERKMPEGPATVLFNDVIFDFDGVLYDSTYSAYKAVELTLEEKADKNIPAPTSIDDIANSYQQPFKEYYARFGIPLKTKEEINAFRDAYREAQKRVNAEHHTPATLFPEVKEVLDKIKEAKKDNPNLKVHIISAGHEDYIKNVLQEGGILNDFDQIHAECRDKRAMIQGIVDAAQVRGKTVMVGDLPSDIKDAQDVDDVRSIAVARGERERERLGMYLPDYIIQDLGGLFDLKSYARELREKNV